MQCTFSVVSPAPAGLQPLSAVLMRYRNFRTCVRVHVLLRRASTPCVAHSGSSCLQRGLLLSVGDALRALCAGALEAALALLAARRHLLLHYLHHVLVL